jgi:RNA polymerase sigma factor (sigma-70 family)
MRVEAALIERAILGDADAIERVLVDCRPDLRRYAQKTCPRFSEVEDAVQSSLISIYRGIGRLRAAGTFAAWAAKIVRRQCWHAARPYTTVGIEGIEDENRYLAKRDDAELRMDLTLAIHSLPPIHRDVLILRDLEQLSVREIADRLGVELGTVKSRVFRARESVREYLLSDQKP